MESTCNPAPARNTAARTQMHDMFVVRMHCQVLCVKGVTMGVIVMRDASEGFPAILGLRGPKKTVTRICL